MGSVVHYFGPGPNGSIRIMSRYEDTDTGMVGHSRSDVLPQAEILGIPWAEFVAAGYGIIDRPEDGPAIIRRVDDQPGDTETGQ